MARRRDNIWAGLIAAWLALASQLAAASTLPAAIFAPVGLDGVPICSSHGGPRETSPAPSDAKHAALCSICVACAPLLAILSTPPALPPLSARSTPAIALPPPARAPPASAPSAAYPRGPPRTS